jgi:hypothetical protein
MVLERLLIIFFNILIIAWVRYGFAGELQDIKNTELLSAIHKLEPRATILLQEDIDKSDCGKKRAGIVEADFNGDGLKDYAVLLRIGDIENTFYNYEGKDYPWRRLKFPVY